ncbi:MAG: pantoate--beta-alanine ligase [Candidatus Aminicenantes bacterium]|nr:pantoate--beta-alanine ligase [Candidatus Aminicenantes bacterium]
MKIVKTSPAIREEIRKNRGKTIGFVPTMGYLHRGHLSLVEQSKLENEVTVVSIFVNPAQFAPHEDFDKYPRDFAMDEKLLSALGVDILFFPDVNEIYPPGYSTYVEVEVFSKVLCGQSRPTHFRGVATVVLKLFNIVTPTNAYFGRKDAQQAVIIKKMAADLDLTVNIKTIPIVRDHDGLALSSRNAYLSAAEREAALYLSRGLGKARQRIDQGLRKITGIREEIRKELEKNELIEIDYIEVVSLDKLTHFAGGASDAEIEMNNTLVAAAIKVGKTRLIDNFILGEI